MRNALAAALALSLASACYAAPGPVPIQPEARTIALGALKVTSIHDADFESANDGKTFGLDVGPAAVSRVLVEAGLPSDAIPLSVSGLLVRGIPGHIVLIDTGLGPKAKGKLIASLAMAGITPDKVTDVLITHSHGDHVGGLVDANGRSAFPNAAIRMSRREWAWMQEQAGAKPIAAAIRAQVRPFEAGTAVLPGIVSVPIFGHTPGHVGYRINSGHAHLIDIGDTAHSSVVSLAEPGWAMGFDTDKKLGKAMRQAVLERLAESHELVFAPHFPFPGTGRVVASGAGYKWQPADK
ncbi:hypothetical protein SCH01S_38_00290 [Sphingomonas changbaiensis NBRC 104936]|uniref:Metallo-beta-lactamase domain-containing protein n=1 Tax=Sphingomonas changbaiensis NBRC 104936 TaxID=1219043 RepID=A0A0E9MQ60_9SPHN|nr:MBL fold metallo-hydrolase [Sphingomonas changbaiensis]GAO39689.1 hypothetical protein SCH01S_38_00290 [Sphingomonas changbaiensis NBRC 104936]